MSNAGEQYINFGGLGAVRVPNWYPYSSQTECLQLIMILPNACSLYNKELMKMTTNCSRLIALHMQ
jgi:hypothetical protein